MVENTVERETQPGPDTAVGWAMSVFGVNRDAAETLTSYFSSEDRIAALPDTLKALGATEQDSDALVFSLAIRQGEIRMHELRQRILFGQEVLPTTSR